MSGLSVLRMAPLADPPATAADRPPAVLVLELTRARARRLALWMRRVWQDGQSSPDQGLAITAEEVERLLAARPDAAVLGGDPELAALDGAIDQAEAALAADRRWSALVAAFGLGKAEQDLLAAAAAVEFDPGLRRVLAYLHDDVRATAPTAALAARLARRTPAVTPMAALARWRLAEPLDGGGVHGLATAWRADPALVLALAAADGPWTDPALAAGAERIAPTGIAGLPQLQPAALKALQACADLGEAELTGPAGCGRRILAAQLAAASGRALLAADLPVLVNAGLDIREAIVRVLRQARADGALAYFSGAEAATAADWALARTLGTPFLRGARESAHARVSIALQPLTTAARLALWRTRSAAPPPEMLLSHRMTPAEVDRLARTPAGRTLRLDRPRPDHSLLRPMPLPYVWDDLVAPPETLRQLRAFADQVRLRWTVLEDWGFSRLSHLGSGIAALFGGPSGAGKTMAAQVLARELGLELYRVDLAGVVNKYIGETEKKLREVFDACEHAGALLFFDEADALFGGRMEVKDAHDRFANIEINYLLQRIESFDGVAILATNRRGDVDQAFLRRLRFVIEFLSPRPDERLALWRKALGPAAYGGETVLGDIDLPFLAERLLMTGAEIKNTTLAAAFLARAQGAPIGMGHLLAAAEREMAKQGARLRLRHIGAGGGDQEAAP